MNSHPLRLPSRRFVVALMGSAAFVSVSGAASADTPSQADRNFETLTRRWLDRSMRLSPIQATQDGDHRFDARIDDVSASGRAAVRRFNEETLRALDGIETGALSRANQVDKALLTNRLRSSIWSDDAIQNPLWNPLYYHGKVGDALYGLMAREYAPVGQRLEAATARMNALPAVFAEARRTLVLERVPAVYAETVGRQNRGLKSIISELIDPHKDALTGAKRAALDAAIAHFTAAVDEHQAWIEHTLTPAARGEFRIGAEKFDQKLAFTLQTSLTRQDVRARAQSALTACREEMYRVAARALAGRAGAPPTPANPTPEQQQAAIRAALDIAAAERAPRDQLVPVATHAVEEATAFVRAHDLITLPDSPVRVILMPEFQRGVAVAYCDSPGPLEHGTETFYAVSPVPDDWTEAQATSFLREYNTRAILDVGVHEAMPGHYVQIWHAHQYPSTLRALLSSGSFVEGWAVYAEDMMATQGFKGDDPLYRLSQLKVQLRTICNAILDQMVHIDGASREDVMHFLVDTAFQEEREAAGKWTRAQLSSTQLSTYFVGWNEHAECRAEAERRWGANFNLKTYHDRVLSFGSPPMRYARALLLDEPIR